MEHHLAKVGVAGSIPVSRSREGSGLPDCGRFGAFFFFECKQLQNLQAFKSGLNYQGEAMHFDLRDSRGLPIPEENLYVPHFIKKCEECSFRILCNGCSDCGGCIPS